MASRGDRVQGNFEEGGKYYSGIVLKVITKKGHATEYLIEYGDGDCEYTISQVMLIFLGLFSGDTLFFRLCKYKRLRIIRYTMLTPSPPSPHPHSDCRTSSPKWFRRAISWLR